MNIFTQKELKDLATPYPDRIIQQIQKGKIKKALELNQDMKNSRVLLHDFFAESCTVLWSFVGGHLGEDRVEDMFRYVFSQSAQRQFFDVTGAGAPAWLTTLMLAKSWRAHSCFGAGNFPGKFSIIEDFEKFTFYLTPCASGARLWQKGIYEKNRGGRLTQKARPWNYNRENFPYYCIHCSFLNEILPYESRYQSLMWPVDPLEKPGDTCAWHVYKDPDNIPELYYKRLGLKKKPGPKNKYKPKKGRYFSDAQLVEMARPTTDRIAEKLEENNFAGAKKLCADVKDEFLVLHDLYINMLAATLDFIARKTGEHGLGKALDIIFEKCVRSQIILNNPDLRHKIIFLATKIFGVDNVNGEGYIPGKFSIRETDSQISFILSPCGSGGRLYASGAYNPMAKKQKIQENLENALIRAAAQIPLPDPLLGMAFPKIVTHFTQRKPCSLGKTRQAHPWSFGKKGVGYYCCFCGIIADKLKGHGLCITPPMDKNQPCVWTIKKIMNL